MFEAKQIHSGQYKRYGDSYDVWEIKTEQSKEETLDWCFENLHKKRVPEKAEFYQNTRCGGAKSGDMDYYFAGYYTIEAIEGGFKFTYVYPWDG